jgi:hypothetical protein
MKLLCRLFKLTQIRPNPVLKTGQKRRQAMKHRTGEDLGCVLRNGLT